MSLGFSLLVLIIYLSLTSNPINVVHIKYSDKLGHFVAYLTLMVWFGQLYIRRSQLASLAILFVGLGVGLEILQGLMGHRFFEIADMAANSIGVLVGWWLSDNLLSGLLLKVESKVIFTQS